ncbi:hypothetical protein BV22DRAFT_828170 [Leucogyrophana mollusca]|uniref:Uncharacterized protein n=1 Tax=Leucogyrophana mollusca TaxID=85980 RepID=A0ACB8B2X8_9AGAM|nr:hypothetical protein BV22DRAFT_828170 [Leucogyrophana mollusca]
MCQTMIQFRRFDNTEDDSDEDPGNSSSITNLIPGPLTSRNNAQSRSNSPVLVLVSSDPNYTTLGGRCGSVSRHSCKLRIICPVY